jgi:hypothetical protein
MCWFTSVDCEDRDKTAEAIMIPAERVDFISLARTFEENLALARSYSIPALPQRTR